MSRPNVNGAGRGQQRRDPQGDEDEENRPQLELEHAPCNDDVPLPPGEVATICEEEDPQEEEGRRKVKPEILADDDGPPVPPMADEGVVQQPPASADRKIELGAVDDDVPTPHQFDEAVRAKGGKNKSPIYQMPANPNASESVRRVTATATPTPASATSQGASPVINQNRGSSRRRRSRSILPALSIRAIRPPPPSMRDPPNRVPSEADIPVFHRVEATAVEGVEATLIPEEPARPVYVNAVEVTTVTALPWWKKHQKWIILILVLIISALVGTIVVIIANDGSQGGEDDSDVAGAQDIDPLLPTPSPTSITRGSTGAPLAINVFSETAEPTQLREDDSDAAGAQNIDPLLPTSSPTSITGGATLPKTLEPTFPPKTGRPTKHPSPPPTPEPTAVPTAAPTAAPTVELVFVEFPARMTIQGVTWLDRNENGLFDNSEPPMEGVFVNLRECYKDVWKATTSTDEIGRYQFQGVEEGEYYIDFFKPSAGYKFTLPRAGGADDRTVDSYVVYLDDGLGKSKCMEVREGFNRLTNAGFVEVESPEPTPSPTARPTMAARPVQPRYCADIDDEGYFDFRGCSLPCIFKHEECPDGMKCALTNEC